MSDSRTPIVQHMVVFRLQCFEDDKCTLYEPETAQSWWDEIGGPDTEENKRTVAVAVAQAIYDHKQVCPGLMMVNIEEYDHTYQLSTPNTTRGK